MDERYARAYAALARKHWWWQARDKIVLGEVARCLRLRQPARILDVGCGDGRLFPALSAYGLVEGLEPDHHSRATGSPAGVIHSVPFQAPLPLLGPYDLLLMLDVLEHLPDRVQSLLLARDLLCPNGAMVVTVPALPLLWTRHDDINQHHVRYTPRTLRQDAADGGFRVVRLRYMFHTLVIPKLIQKGVELVLPAGDAPPTVPLAALNRLLATGFVREASFFESIAEWLPGSSLLAVLERN